MPLSLFPSPDQTISGLSAAMRAGQISSVEIVRRCLAQIDEWESRVHAWVSLDRDAALAAAADCDRELRAGRSRGVLHGMPIGIKDLIDIAGQPTGCGSARQALQIAMADAPLVTRLREAGAIILGKTVTTQFACFDPPVTRNPWNLGRTPGGSSSGSAAAVASGMCLAAIGSQTGGSITRPASFCGVCGYKPTFGRVSTVGVFPISKSLDHPGPIARSVRDLTLLDVIASTSPSLVSVLDSGGSSPPRLARVRGLFDEKVTPVMREALEGTLGEFQKRGATVSEGKLPALFAEVLKRHRIVMLFELLEVHRERFAAYPEDYLPGMRSLIEEAASVSRTQYDEALSHQRKVREPMSAAFGDADVLICSAAVGPAPDPSTTGDPAFNAPWSYTGNPTVSIPIGLSPEGLPLAIQLVGRHSDEPTLFRAALWCEQVLLSRISV